MSQPIPMTITRKPHAEKAHAEKPQEKPLLTKLTEEAVLARLGVPIDLHSVSVHRYTSSRCRVNIRRELTKAAAVEHFRSRHIAATNYKTLVEGVDCSLSKTITLITDSFYLKTNYDGSLCSDNKPITRRY